MVEQEFVTDEQHRCYHEVSNIFPLMTGTEFDALKADIAAHGQREPIWLHQDGRIVDGRNRHRACVELGIAPRFQTWDGDGSLVAFVVSLNLHRRHLTESQRAMIAAKLATMEHGGDRKSESKDQLISRSEAAGMLSVSVPSLQRARVVYTGGAPELVAAVERGDVAVSAAAEIATLPQEWQRVIAVNGDVKEVARDLRNGEPERIAQRMAVHFSSESPEHYTPLIIIKAALLCLDEIDLDPCSNSHDTPNVPAANHYTAEDDGLAQRWAGRVYMNPPYGREIGAWVDKLVESHVAGNVTEAIALVPARTDTQWFARLRDFPVCFVTGRLTFGGNDDPAPFPSAVFYLGDDIAGFYYAFNHLGDIWQRIEPGMFGA